VLATVACAASCHSSAVRQPPGVPPTQGSITRDEPGGDASDPNESALKRLLNEGWGWRNDKQDALHVPLPDWSNWRRIRFFGVPTFVGFRYGDDHHAVIAIWVREADDGTTVDQCLDAFEDWAKPTARSFSVDVGEPTVTRPNWHPSPNEQADLMVKSFDAKISTLFSTKSYAAAYAAYVMWPKTCTIFGFAVPIHENADLAHQVRDRYVKEGFVRMERHLLATPEL
jgi:hypothetical protein